jgi:TP901-1 family phage major tail protein
MTGFKGRKVALTWNGEALGGAREKSIEMNGEPVDVTDDAADGWRTLLEEPGQLEVNISVSGVTKSAVLRTAWFAKELQETLVVTYPTGGGSFTGTFQLVSYTETGAYNDATTYDAEFQSTGEVTYTPPA